MNTQALGHKFPAAVFPMGKPWRDRTMVILCMGARERRSLTAWNQAKGAQLRSGPLAQNPFRGSLSPLAALHEPGVMPDALQMWRGLGGSPLLSSCMNPKPLKHSHDAPGEPVASWSQQHKPAREVPSPFCSPFISLFLTNLPVAKWGQFSAGI